MSVNSISYRAAVADLKTSTLIVPSVQALPADGEAPVSSARLHSASAGADKKVSSVSGQAPGINTHDKAARHMSHVVEVYNAQGKKRTKFMDSHNNVIYQVPSEAAAKLEDLMMKSDTSTNKNG